MQNAEVIRAGGSVGASLAVAEFEGDVLEALDRVEAIHRRTAEVGGTFAGGTFAGAISEAYRALFAARVAVDSWKES